MSKATFSMRTGLVLALPLQSQTITTNVITRDGQSLHTQVWLSGRGKKPVVFSRAYSTQVEGRGRFNGAGYHCVGQRTRGFGGSDGSRFIYDAKDGYDAIDWISKQPWCDGNVVMYGKSYWGITQVLAATEQHPALKAIVPQNFITDLFKWGYRAYGAVTLAMMANGRAGSNHNMAFYRHLPLKDLDLVGAGGENPLWNAYIHNNTYSPYWEKISLRTDGSDGKWAKVKIPVLFQGGWYDYYAGEEIQYYNLLKATGHTKELRISIGPTHHLDGVVGSRGFPGGGQDKAGEAIKFFDYIVKGTQNGMQNEGRIKLYTMGINKWQTYTKWPVPGTRFTPFYLSAPSGSRTGILTTTKPGGETPTTYTYDPNNPVRTLGCGSYPLNNPLLPIGSHDHKARPDIIVFKPAPLTEDTELTGPIKLKLHVSSDRVDTDFTGILVDVYPDGRTYNLCDGIIRMRYRDDLYGKPKFMTPRKIYEVEVDLHATSNVFLKGHRIGIYISSSNFPLWDRNLNSGEDIAAGTTIMKAKNTIYHEAQYLSRIILPVINRGGRD